MIEWYNYVLPLSFLSSPVTLVENEPENFNEKIYVRPFKMDFFIGLNKSSHQGFSKLYFF